ncbi:hypothetical protein BpHYR1_001490 [Brachionus plicatilis]|uniref:Uncharacterized protein n=1 Tax=Brachionus plicatilis TaxID=10195 RepID=A0A3M7QCL2_BRAPC|nr:hypothetical protein BpHYR1_001490 [Brachionus plicatilis]
MTYQKDMSPAHKQSQSIILCKQKITAPKKKSNYGIFFNLLDHASFQKIYILLDAMLNQLSETTVMSLSSDKKCSKNKSQSIMIMAA